MYLLITIISLVISYQLFKLAAGSMSFQYLNMISFIFYYNLVLQVVIGSYIILVNEDIFFNTLVGPSTYETKLLVWLSILYTIISIPVGMLIANLCHNRISIKALHFNYLNKDIKGLLSYSDSYLRYTLYLLTLLSFVSIIYTFTSIGYLPLLKAFTSNQNELGLLKLRQDVGRNFTGNIYVKNIFAYNLMPLLAYIAYFYYKLTKSQLDKCWYIFALLSSIVILTYDLQKAPITRFFLGFVFVYILLNKGISKKKLIKVGLWLLSLLVIIYLVITKKDSVFEALSFESGILRRLTINQVSSMYPHYEIFPEKHEFIGVNSITSLLGDKVDRSARITMQIISPSWIKKGIGGVYNTLFIGEAYANFGIWGVIISPIWVGFIIQHFYIFFLRCKKTPIFLGLLVYYSVQSNITGGLNEYLYNSKLFIISFLLLSTIISSIIVKENLLGIKYVKT